jgi:predicted RNA binding protein YcfA (HicA-like mRNA interferase family)
VSVPKKYRDVRRILLDAGWRPVRMTGSHERWLHSDGRRLTLAGGGKDNREVQAGTLAALRRETGLEELR